MSLIRNRQKSVIANGSTNYTGWITLEEGGVATLEGTFSATVTLQRLGSDGVIVDVTDNNGLVSTMTLPGTYTLSPNQTPSQYRLNCKNGAYTSGTVVMMIEGK